MGLPAVVGPNRLEPVVTPAPPTGGVADTQLNGRLQGTKVGHIRKNTIVATLEDVLGAAIIGSHHWQTAGSRFQQGESKGFRKRRIHKDTPQTGSPSIQLWDLLAGVVLGVANKAVKVVTIDELKKLEQDLPRWLIEVA
jgi:hypothetical protein